MFITEKVCQVVCTGHMVILLIMRISIRLLSITKHVRKVMTLQLGHIYKFINSFRALYAMYSMRCVILSQIEHEAKPSALSAH